MAGGGGGEARREKRRAGAQDYHLAAQPTSDFSCPAGAPSASPGGDRPALRARPSLRPSHRSLVGCQGDRTGPPPRARPRRAARAEGLARGGIALHAIAASDLGRIRMHLRGAWAPPCRGPLPASPQLALSMAGVCPPGALARNARPRRIEGGWRWWWWHCCRPCACRVGNRPHEGALPRLRLRPRGPRL